MHQIGGVIDEIAKAERSGLTYPMRRLSNGIAVQPVAWQDAWIDNPAEGEKWADNASAPYGGRHSPWWRKNMEIELLRGGDPRWPMLSAGIHIRDVPYSELLSDAWCCYRSFDYGIRHATCCAWFAVNQKGDRYFYRQYYRTDADIGTIVKEIHDRTPPEERIIATVADPSLWRRQPQDLSLLADMFARAGLVMVQGDSSIQGYETVASGFMASLARFALAMGDINFLRAALNAPELEVGTAERMADMPAIWFAPEAAQPIKPNRSLFHDCVQLRYQQQRGDPEHRAAPIKTEDVKDEGADVVRYAVQTPGIAWTPNKPHVRREAFVYDYFVQQAKLRDSKPYTSHIAGARI